MTSPRIGRRPLGRSKLAPLGRLGALVAAALGLAGCPSPTPVPPGPPPELEPGREFTLPGEEPPPASSAPAPGASAPPAAPAAGAGPAPSGEPGPSTWTSTSTEPAPLPPGAGDPVPKDGRVGAKHLVVMYKGSRRAPESVTRSRDEAKMRAEECLAKAKAPGAKLEDVVSECTDEPHGKARGGDLYTFPPSVMDPAFSKAVLDLRVGQLSGVVETPFGFHVILRTQ